MDVIVSRCLLGERCRYDGGARPSASVATLCGRVSEEGGRVMGVCPEMDGGLGCPRPPAELRGTRVVTAAGTDVTAAYERGVAVALDRARECSAPLAVLKAKSPACGHGLVYDGSFTGRLVSGSGLCARALEREGIVVVDENVVEGCRASVEHPVAIVLGSGLGALAGLVKPVRRIPYEDIEGFPAHARPIPGHRFEATVGTLDGVPVVVYPGRVHLYQGYGPAEVASLVRHAHKLGCRDIVFACSTGAIAGRGHVGLGLITDHLNLTGANPLVEDEDLACVDSPFVGMTDAYTPYLRELAADVAQQEHIELQQGVYAGLLGPSFETAAEVAALGCLGASFAGMSLVCEAIMAHALGMNVLGLTLAANMAGEAGVTHESVLEVAAQHEADFERLVRGVLARLK